MYFRKIRPSAIAENIFWVPPAARWAHLKAQAKQSTIGQIVDDAMAAVEHDNPSLKEVLPRDYGKAVLRKLHQCHHRLSGTRRADREVA